MLKNIKLTIEYDGTNYHGWQRQKKVPTIQEKIEFAILRMTRQSVSLIGSGRTDAGVHALGQVANFVVDTTLNTEILKNGLNSLLPSDIVIRKVEEADISFHARYNCKEKCYQYHILNHELSSAIMRHFVWHIRLPLDIEKMNEAARSLLGEHDFSAFEGSGSERKSPIRKITGIEFNRSTEERLVISIFASGFLRHMARNIVGTLVSVGKGLISIDDFGHILPSKNRQNAGATAPAHGLFLWRVWY
ncbi:MAG: tRNA pseudouridine(38-40) synthase TruA [Pseudomonadota bacterium]